MTVSVTLEQLEGLQKLAEMLGFEMDINVAHDFVDATIFGSATKSYLTGDQYTVIALKRDGIRELVDSRAARSGEELMQMVLEAMR